MTRLVVYIPSYNDEMANFLTSLYDEGGQSAIYDYVNEHYPNWDWAYCEPCECDSPVWNSNGQKVCAVCFTYFEFDNK